MTKKCTFFSLFASYFIFLYFWTHTKPHNAHMWMVHRSITSFLTYFGPYSCFTPSSCLIRGVEMAGCLQHIPSNFYSRQLLLGSSCSARHLTSQHHMQPGGATQWSVSGGDTHHFQAKPHTLPRTARHVLFLYPLDRNDVMFTRVDLEGQRLKICLGP